MVASAAAPGAPVEVAFQVKCELDVYRELNKSVANGNASAVQGPMFLNRSLRTDEEKS
jgi:hypothetical protein